MQNTRILQNDFRSSFINLLYILQRSSIHITPQEWTYSPKIPKSCNVNREFPSIKLNNGMKMPLLGLGTWGSLAEEATDAVTYALKVGYRLIDCAHVYQNEKYIGKAFNSVFNESCDIKRDNVLITSKLWNTYHRPEVVETAIKTSLKDLKLDQIDVYLMHWPMGYFEGPELFPRDACRRVKFSHVDYIDTWKAMEVLVEKKLTKAIGVCNFNKAQLERIFENCQIKPVVNQIESHPFLINTKLMDFCKSKDVAIMAYSPLGSPSRPWKRDDEKTPLEMHTIQKLACVYRKTPAQILIRYQIQRGNVVIPKSVTPHRILTNIDVIDWHLEDRHMKAIEDLNTNYRFVDLFNEAGKHKYFPFWDEY